MSSFQIQKTKLKCKLFRYALLGYWNNQFGPQARMLWQGTSSSVDSEDFIQEVKTITEVVLKSQAGRELGNSLIDRNVYELDDHGACVVSYVFSIRSTLGPGSLCTLNFVLPTGHGVRFLKFSSVLDAVLTHRLRAYRVIMYKDFDRGNPDRSNDYIEDLMKTVDEMTSILEQNAEQSRHEAITITGTYFFHEKRKSTGKRKADLKDVVQSVLSSFNRIVILGKDDEHKDKILKWCRTCTLLIPEHERDLCISHSTVPQLIPNILVQGCMVKSNSEGDKMLCDYLLQSDYACTILDLRSRRVTNPDRVWTIDLKHHLDCKLEFERNRTSYYLDDHLTDIAYESNILSKLKEGKLVDQGVGRLVDEFVDQIRAIPRVMSLRERFLTGFTSSLYRRAAAVIEGLRQERDTDRGGNINQDMLCKEHGLSVEDLTVVISIAETFEPGVYMRSGIDRADISLAHEFSNLL